MLTTVKELTRIALQPIHGLEECTIVMNREAYNRPVLGYYVAPEDASPTPAYEVIAVADRPVWPTFRRKVMFHEMTRAHQAFHLN